MTATLSGTRDGKPWPDRGKTAELPDAEALHLIRAGLALEATDGDEAEGTPPEETAASREIAEKAVPGGRRRGSMTKSGSE
ncbi:hypothetical protein BU197_02860 [Streptomyces sp. CBMA291]|nr:hypothetical protein [Streptomyces sp. CBMA291]